MSQFGIGSSHVVTRLGHYVLERWGIWTPYFTVFLTKIYPIKQIAHNHEGSFVSILLKGQYREVVYRGQKRYIRHSKWVNIVRYDEYHEVQCDSFVWTLLVMGPRKQDVTARYKGKKIPYTRLIKRYR